MHKSSSIGSADRLAGNIAAFVAWAKPGVQLALVRRVVLFSTPLSFENGVNLTRAASRHDRENSICPGDRMTANNVTV